MSVNFRPAGYEEDSDDDEFSFGSEDSTKRNDYAGTQTSSTAPHCPRSGFGKPPPRKQPLHNGIVNTSTTETWVPKTRTGPKGKPVHMKTRNAVRHGGGAGDGRRSHQEQTGTGSLQNGVADGGERDVKKPNCLSSDVLPTDDFRMAVMRNNVVRVKECLQLGIGVDTVFSTGWTALMYAASYGKEETVRILLDNGADPNYNKDCLSVLLVACSSTCSNEADMAKCVTLLIDKKADVNAFDRHHNTPLHNATKKGKVSVVRKLLEAGADIDKQDNNGYTPLMLAVRQNNLRMMHVLLEAGADYKKQTVAGEKAMDIAQLNGFTKAEDLLRAREDPEVKCNVESILEAAPVSVMSTVEATATAEVSASSHSTHHPIAEVSRPSMKTMMGHGANDVYKHGEMEVFLSGLELSDLIPKFQHHGIDFQDFLRMSDADLQQLGITQMGMRKRILDAIQDTHKTTWQTSSVNIVQYNKPITCADAVAMVSNIKKHSSYIGSSIGYITDQIKADSNILAQAEEHCGAGEIAIQSEEAITNVKFLYEELVVLRSFLTEVAKRPKYRPADLVDPKRSKYQHRSWISTKTILFGVVFSGTVYYNRDTVSHWFSLFCDKLFLASR